MQPVLQEMAILRLSVGSWGPLGRLLGASWGLLGASSLLPGPDEPRGKPMQGPKEALEIIFVVPPKKCRKCQLADLEFDMVFTDPNLFLQVLGEDSKYDQN